MALLSHIDSPADLRKLSEEQLPELAQEIREKIIRTVSETGGHLAANLGAVELTVALHYALNTPQDKIVFDVGHQCYTHKLLTGRREQFSRLRQENGPSGFCNREESGYDQHTSGHASDSISLALGLALARDLQGEDHQVAAVIGDGALTGGMALEALNQAGFAATPLLVILNDNEMSIRGNVGALSRSLSRLRSGHGYNRAKDRTRRVLEALPLLGHPLYRGISAGKKLLKKMLVPGGIFFEDLGFVYLGPIDGHDIPTIIELLRQAVRLQRPVLLHLRTIKGKGYGPAEERPEKWHGTSPFHIETGQPKQASAPSFTVHFGRSLCERAAADSRICAISAAMTDGTGLGDFAARFPDRFFDTGITEQHAAGLAAGLAMAGKRPVLAIYSTFLQRSFDQLLEDICLQRLPVLLAVDRAGIVGADGYSHQGQFDISYLRAMPGMVVAAPSDVTEQKLMLDWALQQDSPCALRWPRSDAFELPAHPHPALQTGRGLVLKEGGDIAIFALGSMVRPALEAATLLQERGVSARVVDARFAAPLDSDLLRESLHRCQGRLLTVEENVASGGFGEACLAQLAGEEGRMQALALPNSFLPHGKREAVLSRLGLDAQGIAQAAERLVTGEK